MKLANLIKLHVAAFHFAKSPDCTAQKLAQLTDVKSRPSMDGYNALSGHAALDALHFTGDRAFARKPTRDTIRDAGGLVEEAFEIYKTARIDGHTRKKAVTEVVNEMELNRRRINTWAKRYEWEEGLTTLNDEDERNFRVKPRRA